MRYYPVLFFLIFDFLSVHLIKKKNFFFFWGNLPGVVCGSGLGLNGDLQQTSMDPGQFPPTNCGGGPCGAWLWGCLLPRLFSLPSLLPVVFNQRVHIQPQPHRQEKCISTFEYKKKINPSFKNPLS